MYLMRKTVFWLSDRLGPVALQTQHSGRSELMARAVDTKVCYEIKNRTYFVLFCKFSFFYSQILY